MQFLSESATENFNRYVLLIEDQLICQKMVKLMLENVGCKVDVASNGQQALKLFSKNSYDIVFTDIQLPDINGVIVSQKMRKKENKRKHTPIIALTAHALEQEQQFFLKAGIDSVITKPIHPEQLIEILQKNVSK